MTIPTAAVNYAQYLHGQQWPSNSSRNAVGTPALESIDAMAPQHAAACLAKLVRWVRETPVGQMQLADIDTREEYVRHTNLGHALAAKALGLPDIETVYGLYSDTDDLTRAQPIDIRTLLGDVFSMLVETHPLANHADLGQVAAKIVGDLAQRYNYLPKPEVP